MQHRWRVAAIERGIRRRVNEAVMSTLIAVTCMFKFEKVDAGRCLLMCFQLSWSSELNGAAHAGCAAVMLMLLH